MDSEGVNVTDVQVDQVQTDPVVDGQEVLDGATDSYEVLPLDQYADKRVPIKVDGSEDYIPLAEAVAGYQRQADYTRKTQELASQREELGWAAAVKAALDADPAGTIAILASNYGLQAPSATPPTSNGFDDDLWGNDDAGYGATQADPRYSQLEQRLAQMEAQAQEAQLRQTIATLSSKFPDFDPRAVIPEAIRRGTHDLEAVYKQMAFDTVAAQKAALEQQLAADAQRRQAKQDASIVSGGSSVPAQGSDTSGEINSIADAWRAAKRQHGLT